MNIGFIGLGAMGTPMATNLISAGYQLKVFNRSDAKTAPLVDLGAERCPTPGAAAKGSEIVITMVSDTPDVEEVLFGRSGVATALKQGAVVIDMSTIDPSAAATFAQRLLTAGIGFVDAPVSGGTEGAAAGTLSIMAGGRRDHFETAFAVLEVLGSKVTYLGPPGSGQMAKAVNQVIIAGTFLAVAEGITLATALGLNTGELIPALNTGAASSWVLANRAERMLERAYPLGFKTKLHRKDLRIALAAAEAAGLNLMASSYVAKIEDELIARGFGDADMSSIAESLYVDLYAEGTTSTSSPTDSS